MSSTEEAQGEWEGMGGHPAGTRHGGRDTSLVPAPQSFPPCSPAMMGRGEGRARGRSGGWSYPHTHHQRALATGLAAPFDPVPTATHEGPVTGPVHKLSCRGTDALGGCMKPRSCDKRTLPAHALLVQGRCCLALLLAAKRNPAFRSWYSRLT